MDDKLKAGAKTSIDYAQKMNNTREGLKKAGKEAKKAAKEMVSVKDAVAGFGTRATSAL
jgi:hypothetical protein